MGVIAIQYQTASDSPLLAAFNREEKISRQCQGPRIQSGRPRVVCGIDRNTGGTWAGVNQHGLFIAVVNCPKRHIPYDPRSRGLLCKVYKGSYWDETDTQFSIPGSSADPGVTVKPSEQPLAYEPIPYDTFTKDKNLGKWVNFVREKTYELRKK